MLKAYLKREGKILRGVHTLCMRRGAFFMRGVKGVTFVGDKLLK